MAQLLVLVIDNTELTPDILTAWETAGVPGVTLVDSTSSHRGHDDSRDDLPFVVSLRSVLESQEKRTQMLFSVIESDVVCSEAVNAVLKLIPDLGQGHRDIMFTMPVTRVWGYPAVPASE
ncbi:MAG: hypothetical protein IT331_25370 [Anaerolineae bacterium]|nr:hypothetical protein [Anaerolineae bacterium]